MSGNPVISIEQISKRYRLGHTLSSDNFREMITSAMTQHWRGKASSVPATDADFWALRDVSFSVDQGEVVGILGRNGAGKSTLLKILSRITPPTAGRAHIRGRVGSLLEVGTGFHHELTGRENIFLNGAVLGMKRSEIMAQFDRIVAFAEIEKFLDTPVKRYSSGMYVRLAFAVAAHLTLDVMFIDEVLAVGDVDFQKKCLARMDEAARGGRTILFVSHNVNAVERLCQRVIVLERGTVAGIYTDVRQGISRYLDNGVRTGTVWENTGHECSNDYFVPSRIEARSTSVNSQANGAGFPNTHPIEVTIEGEIRQTDRALQIGLALFDETGSTVFRSYTIDRPEQNWPQLSPGPVRLAVTIPPRLLNEGTYRAELVACLFQREWLIEPGRQPAFVSFTIQGGLSDSPYWTEKRQGVIAPVLNWIVC
jgi:lipopolysaccharide transport system ATP-binding protein